MKKLIAITLAVLTVFSFTTVAFAESTTTLTTTVPDAEYTLNIPANQEIPFGETKAEIGVVTVTNSSGFAVGKNLEVEITYGDFTCENVSTTIPFELACSYSLDGAYKDDLPSGDKIIFLGKEDTTIKKMHEFPGNASAESATLYYINVDSSDWGKALGGDYTATITFTAEVVAE